MYRYLRSLDSECTVRDIIVQNAAAIGRQGQAQGPVGEGEDEADHGEDLVPQHLAKVVSRVDEDVDVDEDNSSMFGMTTETQW